MCAALTGRCLRSSCTACLPQAEQSFGSTYMCSARAFKLLCLSRQTSGNRAHFNCVHLMAAKMLCAALGNHTPKQVVGFEQLGFLSAEITLWQCRADGRPETGPDGGGEHEAAPGAHGAPHEGRQRQVLLGRQGRGAALLSAILNRARPQFYTCQVLLGGQGRGAA